MNLPQYDDYLRLFLNEKPMLDVRAPIEFEQGAFPRAKNIPLMNNEERTAVGIRYKEAGQEAAIKLGHSLVSGDVKKARIEYWEQFVRENPEGVLYCFRGGLRSRITQQWILENTGIEYPRVKGGYKSMRRFLINELESSSQKMTPLILSGRTGIGKTVLLNRLDAQIDLEDIYYHRGSVFGRHARPQPSQIDIENKLAIALLKLNAVGKTNFILEDEAANIGSRRIPETFLEKMRSSPLIIMEESFSERAKNIHAEYILSSLAEYQLEYGEDAGFDIWEGNLRDSLLKIQKRLGGLRYTIIEALMDDALRAHKTQGNLDDHYAWIEKMLSDYYDPMYDYQMSLKKDRMIFQGSKEAVLDFLQENYNIRQF